MTVLFLVLSTPAVAEDLAEPAGEKSLNTANVIRSAWELKRLSESLAPNIDTRCYIAKFASFKAQDLPKSADIVRDYQQTDSDVFAIQSAEQAMDEFTRNNVQEIANECKQKNNS